MSSTKKKTFFGSLFEFSDAAAQELIANLQSDPAELGSVPFFVYDKKLALFSCEVRPEDHEKVSSRIISQIDQYVDRESQLTRDPVDSPRLRPIEGTEISDEVKASSWLQAGFNTLIDADGPENVAKSGKDPQDAIVRWKPACKDITILSAEFANAISKLTGCSLYFEPAEQGIRLVGSNLEPALHKLRNLEHVLTLSFNHRSKALSRADSNICLMKRTSNLTVRLVRPSANLSSLDRIVLHSTQRSLAKDIVIGESQVYNKNQFVRAGNLDTTGLLVTQNRVASQIFDGFSMSATGESERALPRKQQVMLLNNSTVKPETDRPQNNLPQKDLKRVDEWRASVQPQAPPSIEPADSAIGFKSPAGRRRIVATDSDEEDEDEMAQKTDPVGAESPVTHHNATESRDDNSTFKNDHGASIEPGPDSKITKGSLAGKNPGGVAAVQANTFCQPFPRTKTFGKSKDASTKFQGRNIFNVLSQSSDDEIEPTDVKVGSHASSDIKQLNVTELKRDRQPTTSSLGSSDPTMSVVADSTPSIFNVSTHGPRKCRVKFPTASPQMSHSSSLDQVRSTRLYSVPSHSQVVGRHLQSSKDQTQNTSTAKHSAAWHEGSACQTGDLIDVSSSPLTAEPVVPPPGYEYRATAATSPLDLLESTNELPHRPALLPVPSHSSKSDMSLSKSGSTSLHPSHLDFTPQLTIPRRDISYLQERATSSMNDQFDYELGKSAIGVPGADALAPQRMQESDEVSTRRYFNTMSQKTSKRANGDKKKEPAQQTETKAEREARIAKVKAEAYGEIKPVNASDTRPLPSSKSKSKSPKKREPIEENRLVADVHHIAADRLVEKLRPILDATRAFKGEVRVEMQIGQALILKNELIDEGRYYATKEFAKLLDSAQVAFTNVLTTNGGDIDRLLEMTSDSASTKLWDKNAPGPSSIDIEFSCLDKSGGEFLIVIDQNGQHHLRRHNATLGEISLHYPSQIWDACVVVLGVADLFEVSEEIEKGVEEFVKSIYLPAQSNITIYFRLPSNNAFTIKLITVKRVSLHNAISKSQKNLRLRLSEIKKLVHSTHAEDESLYRSHEDSYETMVKEDRVHYEVAISDDQLDGMFQPNESIELGELTPIPDEKESVFNYSRARKFIEATTHMLEHMDWVGAHNIGTFRKEAEIAASTRASIIAALHPNLDNSIRIPMGITAHSTTSAPSSHPVESRPNLANTAAAAVTAEPVPHLIIPGVRANTAAELYQANGELFYIGQGGARIPVPLNPTDARLHGTVMPEDSASQVGNGGMRAVQNRIRGRLWEDKPAGFW